LIPIINLHHEILSLISKKKLWYLRMSLVSQKEIISLAFIIIVIDGVNDVFILTGA